MRSVICGEDEREVWLHGRAYDSCDGVEVAGVVCGGDGPSAKRASGMGIRVLDDFESILTDKTVDIVEILPSSPDRVDRALEVLEAGKHLLISPPFGDDVATAKQLHMASNKSHGLMMVAEKWKFFPPVAKMARLVTKKTVGRVTSIRMRTVAAGSGGWDEYLNSDFRGADPEQPVDYKEWLFNEIFEKLSIAYDLLGPIKEIYCVDQKVGEGGATVLTWQHTKHAMYGALDITRAPGMNIRSAYYPRDDNFELTGPSGIMWLTLGCSQMKAEPTIRIYRGENQFAYGNLDDDWLSAYCKCLEHFITCIRTGRPPQISPKSASVVMGYASAAMESATTGNRAGF